jgi:hypothetical protein
MSQGTPAAPALPLEIFLPRRAQFCIPPDLCQIFGTDTIFRQFQFRCRHIFSVRDIQERRHNIPISINALARAFDCPRSSVHLALAHGLESPGERGKHPALDADREQQILDWTCLQCHPNHSGSGREAILQQKLQKSKHIKK